MSYNYVVTAQKPTAVNACITGERRGFTFPNCVAGPFSCLHASCGAPALSERQPRPQGPQQCQSRSFSAVI